MAERVAELESFADGVADDGVDAIVLLGMGGSSLAPEVIRRTFRVESFHVLDTTHPRAIRTLEASLDLERTLFISASKSGSTLETRSHTDYFWQKSGKQGSRFVAITDPGSELERVAGERGFRHVFSGQPTIGGRYSALSPFGIVPAALMGVDVSSAAGERRPDGRGLPAGRAQSRLRARRGVRHRLAGGPRQDLHCGDRRRLRPLGRAADRRVDREARQGARSRARRVARRSRPAGRPPRVADPYSLGAEFFRWEFAVAVAGASISRSTRSTSPTCRRRRTRRTRCSRRRRARPRAGGVDRRPARAGAGAGLHLRAGVRRAERGERPPHRRSRAEASRAQRARRDVRLRAALPALDRAAAQGGPEHRPLPAGHRRSR